MTARGLKRYLKKRVEVHGTRIEEGEGGGEGTIVLGTGYLVAIDGGALHLAPSARSRATQAIDLAAILTVKVVPVKPALTAHKGGKVCPMPRSGPSSDEGPGAA